MLYVIQPDIGIRTHQVTNLIETYDRTAIGETVPWFGLL